MSIRLAQIDDKLEVAKIFVQENKYHYDLQPDVFNVLSEDEILPDNWYEDILKSDTQHIYLLEENNSIAGLIMFTELHNLDTLFKHKLTIYINELIVYQAHRGKGYGKALIEYVDLYATKHHADHIRLDVWENNPRAISVYEKSGYKIRKHNMWKDIKKK